MTIHHDPLWPRHTADAAAAGAAETNLQKTTRFFPHSSVFIPSFFWKPGAGRLLGRIGWQSKPTRLRTGSLSNRESGAMHFSLLERIPFRQRHWTQVGRVLLLDLVVFLLFQSVKLRDERCACREPPSHYTHRHTHRKLNKQIPTAAVRPSEDLGENFLSLPFASFTQRHTVVCLGPVSPASLIPHLDGHVDKNSARARAQRHYEFLSFSLSRRA